MKLWNVGIKVGDVSREVEFFERLGGKTVAREKRSAAAEDSEYAILEFAGTRLFITSRPLFEALLSSELRDGLTHIVFESDELEPQIEAAIESGATQVMERRRIVGDFGSREIAFLRSPGGVIFEVMTIHENETEAESA